MKLISAIFSLIVISFIGSYANAGPCSNSQFDKAEFFAEIAGGKIIEQYGGGQDKRISLVRCSFNSYSNKYKLKVEVYWSGSIFRDNKYNVDGELTVGERGNGAKFAKTYQSSTVDDLNILFGALALGTLVAEGADSGSGYSIKFNNSCHKSVRVAVRYRNMRDEWKVEYWWDFDGYEEAYLSVDNNRLKTNAATIYYFAKSSNSEWRGEHVFRSNGNTFKMRKIKDKEGETEIRITCS